VTHHDEDDGDEKDGTANESGDDDRDRESRRRRVVLFVVRHRCLKVVLCVRGRRDWVVDECEVMCCVGRTAYSA
jgi:hypothetical protein